jgi:hypothetical protein
VQESASVQAQEFLLALESASVRVLVLVRGQEFLLALESVPVLARVLQASVPVLALG